MIRIVVFVAKRFGEIYCKRQVRLQKIVTYTTRSPRSGEIPGVHSSFTDRESLVLNEEGRLLEYSEYNGNLYATSMDSLKTYSKVMIFIRLCLIPAGQER